jgi:tRNA uridine 5-carboxymethylaminomethyl modification enzyme
MTVGFSEYDVLVIGGGHAGCEAYAAACRLGSRTLMVVPDTRTIGLQPCNPAVGGPGKGHLVREIVALGGLMGSVTDCSGLQFRTLHRTRGPAVRATRVQTDSAVYAQEMSHRILHYSPNGDVIEDFAEALLWSTQGSKRRIRGVRLEHRGEVLARSVVVATGTYLRGTLYIGDEVTPGGRTGGRSSVELARCLESLGLPLIRLKTGTCPRLAGDSIRYAMLEPQHGDDPPRFSIRKPPPSPFCRKPAI